MTYSTFIKVYNARIKSTNKSAESQLNLIAEIIKPKPYLSFDDKLEIIDKTIEYVKQSKHPTANRYRYFVLNIIDAYTELEQLDKTAFDELSQLGLIDPILSTFEREYEFCTSLLNMCIRDQEGM